MNQTGVQSTGWRAHAASMRCSPVISIVPVLPVVSGRDAAIEVARTNPSGVGG